MFDSSFAGFILPLGTAFNRRFLIPKRRTNIALVLAVVYNLVKVYVPVAGLHCVPWANAPLIPELVSAAADFRDTLFPATISFVSILERNSHARVVAFILVACSHLLVILIPNQTLDVCIKHFVPVAHVVCAAAIR